LKLVRSARFISLLDAFDRPHSERPIQKSSINGAFPQTLLPNNFHVPNDITAGKPVHFQEVMKQSLN
jgi:hypothetical protein